MPHIKRSVFPAVFLALFFISCNALSPYHLSVDNHKSYSCSYDDTTLTPDNSEILMPYNRIIDPAGTVIRYGKTSLENHSLDCTLLPGENVLAVEDRYGVAFIDIHSNKLLYHIDYDGQLNGFTSVYSGIKAIKTGESMHIFWGAANPGKKTSLVFDAVWNGSKATIKDTISFKGKDPAPIALPNDIAFNREGDENYLYIVLNGNSQLTKIRMRDKKEMWTTQTGMAPFGIAIASSKAYVSNWAGPVPTDTSRETAGIPYSNVYVNPKTGATSSGTISVIDLQDGKTLKEIEVGLHPNAIIASKDRNFIYVANGNSDDISVIDTKEDKVVDSISVKLGAWDNLYVGDSPNALAIDKNGSTLYVANGMDNAIAVVSLGSASSGSGKGKSSIKGFIPTEAYPAGLAISEDTLFVANLEGEGAGIKGNKIFNSHQQEATISIIPIPDRNTLKSYTSRVERSNFMFRSKVSQRLPRKGVSPKPVPERIGEPSVFKHVVYIIKENKTYDQVMGDVKEGDGMNSLCIYGKDVTPNQHKLVKDFLLLDNYYASGKCSAEGHSWTDAAIVTDYLEKNVRAWFRSYPHVLADAMAYNKEGFIWNNALDHGKSVRIYGEACRPIWKGHPGWESLYQSHLDGKPAEFENEVTISRVKPILSPAYPGFDGPASPDQLRSDAFIKELEEFEKMPGDQLPQLIIMALPADHTVGTREGYPTPRAMVADNDLALGKILEALTKSKFWDSTAVFITEDDSQSGWDHVSAYRTTGFVVSPYSHLHKTVHTNYNQTCMLRTIEQILGIPPMNIIDATALPMFNCFDNELNDSTYRAEKNLIPLNEMNQKVVSLTGKAKKYAILSATPQFDKIDGGDDDLLNHILWYSAKGNLPYPNNMTLPKKEREDDDDD